MSKSPAPNPSATATRKRRGWKWIFLGLLVLLGAIGWASGLLGFGLAALRSATFPSDRSLVAYVPVETGAVVVVDPHQLELKAFGADGGKLREAIDGRRVDLERATGIDVALDVDKVVLAPGLVVARGRFDAKRLTARLAERRYLPTEHRGATVLERAGEDAIAIVDDAILLYGSGPSVVGALDAAGDGRGLDTAPATMERLDALGWDHPVIATVSFGEGGASLRDILTGATGPRAFTLGLSTKGGIDVDLLVEAASVGAAADLAKLLEERRKDVEGLRKLAGDEALGAKLAELAAGATITTAAERPDVHIHAHLSPETVEALGESAGRLGAQLEDAYGLMRLYQLLVPSP